MSSASGDRLAEFGILDTGGQDIVQRDTRYDVPVSFIATVAALAGRISEMREIPGLASRDAVAEIALSIRRQAGDGRVFTSHVVELIKEGFAPPNL